MNMVGYYIIHRWVNMLFSYKCKYKFTPLL